MTIDDMIWESKASLYNELGKVMIDRADNKKANDICYNIAIYSALESIGLSFSGSFTQTGNKFGSDNNVTDTNKLWNQLKETLSRYEQVNSSEYDGFDSTDEWKDSLETEDRKILDVFDELKQDKTGTWFPANDRDKIYESIRENHSKLYNSWYFRDDDERNNLEDKIDNICYMITIINEFNRMNN